VTQWKWLIPPTVISIASGTLKKVALELGGKNPQVIFPDADLESAADAVTFGVYFNAGECCNSGSRIIVHEDIAEAFVKKVVALSAKVPFGDPLDPATQVGAIISTAHQGKIEGYVRDAEKAGAEVRLGGAGFSVPGLPGQFYEQALLPTAQQVVGGKITGAQAGDLAADVAKQWREFNPDVVENYKKWAADLGG
jgi:acyl-CoA reductase-like NAD-dependent aldehyde dehydrogenase